MVKYAEQDREAQKCSYLALYKIKISVKTKWQHFVLCIATRPKVGPTWCNNTVDVVSSFTHKKRLSIFIQ